MAQMKQTSTILENKVAALEDAKCQRNLRIRGIPEAVQDPEVSHYIRRILASLLLPAKAKSILLGFHFHIPKPPRAPADISRDLLIRFQSLRGKLLVQEAAQETNTYEFEGSELSFYNDLSRTTVTWRHSMKEVTQLRRTKGIQYRWGPGRRLSVSNEGKRVHITQASDFVAFLQSLGNIPGGDYKHYLRSNDTSDHIQDMGRQENSTHFPKNERCCRHFSAENLNTASTL
ncbi:Hypothetical predicted protein [Pelobates cultripes]|uniref:Uncharacterized protein n=1 Tax=Pelobates cultripes TaxID=61616 RepID=A0AAD1T7F9_PELCU|nr:Hypothetical predicted protein [Pelobates cultripes]